MTETTERTHKHSFPCQPPRGSLLNPGPCECGKTYSQDMADRQLAEALEGVEIAYGVPPRMHDEWAVAWGSANLNDGTGYVEIRDDEEEAREYRDLYAPGSSVVRRTVIALAWEAVPAKPDSAGDFPCCTGCGPSCGCGGAPHETPESVS